MNSIKKIFGVIWLLSTVGAGYFLVSFGYPRFTSGTQDGIVFGIIILFILLPLIVCGLGTFGYYALIGEYNKENE